MTILSTAPPNAERHAPAPDPERTPTEAEVRAADLEAQETAAVEDTELPTDLGGSPGAS